MRSNRGTGRSSGVTKGPAHRFLRALAVMASLALVAGLAASAPPARAAASNLTITIDPGPLPSGYDASDMQAILDQANSNPVFSDAINRQVQSYVASNLPGFNEPSQASFDATATQTADDTGVEVTVNAADAPQSPLSPWWNNSLSPIIGNVVGFLLRALCQKEGLQSEPTAFKAKVVKTACASGGAVIATFITAMLVDAWAGTTPDATTWGQALVKALGTALSGAFLWESGMWEAIYGGLRKISISFATWTGNTAWPWVKSAVTSAFNFMGTVLAKFTAALPTIPLPGVGASSPPCDIYNYYATPCGDAYSTTRALYSAYGGPLYEVQRASDNTTTDIYPVSPGGDADAAAQDTFCANTTCTITKIFDQSPDWDDLNVAPGGEAAPNPDHPASAAVLPIKLGGSPVYGVQVTPGVGYRDNQAQNLASDGEPEGMYMVASGTNVNSQCCFDFGNGETDSRDNNAGHMDALNLSTTCYFAPCSGSGPWVQADMENGLFQGKNGSNTANTGNSSNFVTAMLKNDGQTTYTLEGGDAQSGGLSTWWDGLLPTIGGYMPMQQEGAAILGTGGDNSNGGIGSFFEGAMTQGYPAAAADTLIQENIVQAAYTGNSSGQASGSAGTAEAAGSALTHSGYTSVFTVNAANDHLQESYLSNIGNVWATHDLNALAGTPPVMAGTEPVALFHCGYTSVFTVDASNGHVQETYLSNIGNVWATHDLNTLAGTPATHVTPTAVLHDAGATGLAASCGFTSVYTVDAASADLQETYLPYIGDAWTTQDLTANFHTPAVQPGTSPVAIVHGGYTSVFTVDENHHLQETYLSNIGNSWATHDLNTLAHTPLTATTPTAVVHYAGATGAAATSGFTSVYTVDDAGGDLQETYLPYVGASWTSQNLTAEYHTPRVAPGTQPEALYHTGYTSVFTVDGSDDHLQETYLSNIGNVWATHDLNAIGQTPPTADSPIVLLHPDASGALTWTSVYTMNEGDNHLQETYLPAIGDSWTSQDLTVKYGTPPVRVMQFPTAGWSLAHAGYTSAFTVNASNGHLQETYLSNIGNSWATHDLNLLAHTPPVEGETQPVALYHDGYVSVFTVDADGDLRETYLSNIGNVWATHDLSAMAGTPSVQPFSSPTAVYHDGYVSVYTINASNHDLQETYLSNIGNVWASHDLSALANGPSEAQRTSPSAVYHDGYVSVYTQASSGDLQETYLPGIGDNWTSQDLTARYHTPAMDAETSPSALDHTGYVSVFTVDAAPLGDLQETYLPAIGDSWSTQDLTTLTHGPTVIASTYIDGTPVVLYHTGYTSVYTLDFPDGHLRETYLSNIGGSWATHDLTEIGKAPVPSQRPAALLHYDADGGLTWISVFSASLSSGHLEETYLPAIGDTWTTQDLGAQVTAPTS